MDTTRMLRIGPVALLATAALAFLLPFGTVACDGETVSFTGVELATSRVEPDSQAPAAPDQGLAGEIEGSGSLPALIALALVLGALASASWRGRGGGFATGATGCMLVLLFHAATTLASVEIHVGFWIAFVATAAAGVLRLADRMRRRRSHKREEALARRGAREQSDPRNDARCEPDVSAA